jgi:hypothetical protein
MDRCCGQATMVHADHVNSWWGVELLIPQLKHINEFYFCVKIPCATDANTWEVAARQACYIKWAEIFRIQDPCGYYPGYQRIVVIYIKYIQNGVNYNNKMVLQSATVRGYAKAVSFLF